MKELIMKFTLGNRKVVLALDENDMFHVRIGPSDAYDLAVAGMTAIGTHCERAIAVDMFNHEVRAMQAKWEDET